MAKESINQYVERMVKWFYGVKISRDVTERSFQDAKHDFNVCMEKYFDAVVNEDGKLDVEIDDIKNVRHIIVSRITPSNVKWDYEKLKKILSPKERKLVIQKSYNVVNWKGLFDLLKKSGVDFKEFLKYVEITESVREEQLDKLIELGVVDEDKVKDCSSVKLNCCYYKFTEK